MSTLLQKNLWILLILLLTFGVRFYRFDNPIADWHSWRQADTSAVSRNFLEHGFDVLHPRYYDISNVQSGMDNPQGYRMVEFPIYNVFQAVTYKYIGILTLEEWGRLITIIVTTLTAWLLYLLVKRHANERVALFSALVFGLLPYNIYYGRVILPDPHLVGTTLASIYFFDLWLGVKNSKNKASGNYWYFVLAILFSATAMLLKPFAALFFLPILVLVWEKYGISFLKKWQLWVFAILTILPFALWRVWIMQYPEGIPAAAWLFNGNGIRFRPAFFRWIGYERITKLISGYAGILFLVLGVIGIYKEKQRLFFFSFLLSSILYVSIVATGNVQHDYYQILIMPSIALVMAFGAEFILTKIKQPLFGYSMVTILLLVSFIFSWNQVKDYFNINNWAIVKAGEAVQKFTPKDALIIAPYDGDTSLLYQMDRKGWPSFEHSTEELMNMGADYLLIVNPKPQDNDLSKKYKLVSQTNDYILVNLHEKP